MYSLMRESVVGAESEVEMQPGVSGWRWDAEGVDVTCDIVDCKVGAGHEGVEGPGALEIGSVNADFLLRSEVRLRCWD